MRSPYGVVHGKSSPVYYDEKGEEGLLSGLSKYVLTIHFIFCKFVGFDENRVLLSK